MYKLEIFYMFNSVKMLDISGLDSWFCFHGLLYRQVKI